MKKIYRKKTLNEVCEMMLFQPLETAREILKDYYPDYRLDYIEAEGITIIFDETDSEVVRICDDLEN